MKALEAVPRFLLQQAVVSMIGLGDSYLGCSPHSRYLTAVVDDLTA